MNEQDEIRYDDCEELPRSVVEHEEEKTAIAKRVYYKMENKIASLEKQVKVLRQGLRISRSTANIKKHSANNALEFVRFACTEALEEADKLRKE